MPTLKEFRTELTRDRILHLVFDMPGRTMNVIDMTALRLHRPKMLFDLPAGGRRLVQRAGGYRHTLVAGQETYRNGEPTSSLPGRLVRGPRPAPAST